LELRRVLENAGMISVADTKAQMEKVNDVLKEYLQGGENNNRFVAIVDEGTFPRSASFLGGRNLHFLTTSFIVVFAADAMYRTYDKSQQFEKQYEIFMNNESKEIRPCVRFLSPQLPFQF